jgi:hypothetical protein
VQKLKSMDWDRVRVFLKVARTGMRVNRRHKALIAPARSTHCFVLRNTDYRTTSICQVVWLRRIETAAARNPSKMEQNDWDRSLRFRRQYGYGAVIAVAGYHLFSDFQCQRSLRGGWFRRMVGPGTGNVERPSDSPQFGRDLMSAARKCDGTAGTISKPASAGTRGALDQTALYGVQLLNRPTSQKLK